MEKETGLNWLGAETEEDQGILWGRLEQIYNYHSSEDGAIGTPDFNHKIVTEALRIKLLGSELIKEEFDDPLHVLQKKDQGEFISVEPSVYDAEIERIRNMTELERNDLQRLLLKAQGYKQKNGGLIRFRDGCDDSVTGFAFHTLTQEEFTTRDPGSHFFAKSMFATEEGIPETEIVAGLIIERIPGFETPLLVILDENIEEVAEEKLLKAVRYLMKKKKYIPLTESATIYEDFICS